MQKKVITDLQAALVVNINSRKGKKLLHESRKLLIEKGINLQHVFTFKRTKELKEIIVKVFDSNCKLVIIGGGDGTISSVVDYFAYTDISIGILPLGTANSFAKTLNIPLNLSSAIDLIIEKKVQKVDLGKVNDDYFANTANIGFPVTVALNISDKLKKVFGKFSYLIVGFYNFFSYKTFTATIKFKDKIITEKVAEIVIANGKHQGGILVAPDARVDSNKILIKVVKGKSKWSLIKLWFFIMINRHTDLDFIDYYEVDECIIETKTPKHVNIDGEIKTTTPIRVSIAKDALNLIARIDQ